MPYVNLLGNEEVSTAWGPLRGLPTKFLVDKQGRIVETFFQSSPSVEVIKCTSRALPPSFPSALTCAEA